LPAARLGLRWCPQVRYEEPPHIAHDEADQVLRAALRGETTQPDVNSVLVGLALDDDDRAFVERWCVRIARRRTCGYEALRHCALVVARRFGEVSDEAAALVRELAADETMRSINGQVLDAAADRQIGVTRRPRARRTPRSPRCAGGLVGVRRERAG
jgi:hypothetical protein